MKGQQKEPPDAVTTMTISRHEDELNGDGQRGRPRLNTLTDLIRYKLKHMYVTIDGVEKLAEEWVAEQLILKAIAGNERLLPYCCDRSDGKPQISLQVTDKEYEVIPAPPSPDLIQNAEVVEESDGKG